MKICVISDIHDNLKNLRKAIEKINSVKPILVVFCGDFVSPFVIKEFSKFKSKVYAVFGNNEGDINSLIKACPKNVELFYWIGECRVNKVKIAFTHFPAVARQLAKRNYDFVFYGHTHLHKVERTDKCLVINPGEICGLKEEPRFLVVDVESKSYEFKKVWFNLA